MKNLKVIINKNSNIVFDENEYDNYAFDGKAIIIEKENRLVAIYSINHIIGAYECEKE